MLRSHGLGPARSWGPVALLLASSIGCSSTPDSNEHACEVRHSSYGETKYAFDEDTGRLTTAEYVFELDTIAGTIAVYGNEAAGAVWYWTTTYDEQGNMTHDEHNTGSVVDFVNRYDDSRLTRVEVMPLAGPEHYPRATVTYAYKDPSHPELWTRQDTDNGADGSIDSYVVRELEEGKVVLATSTSLANATASSGFTYAYEGDRIESIDSDFSPWVGADGTADIRYSWRRGADGSLLAYEQDGTYSFDHPYIDGVADYREEYSSGCAALLEQYPWIAHLPDENELSGTLSVPTIWKR